MNTYSITWNGRSRLVAIWKDGEVVNRIGSRNKGRDYAEARAREWIEAREAEERDYEDAAADITPWATK